MSNIGNKETLSKNLLYYLDRSGKSQKEVAEYIGVTPASLNEWVKAKKYPRIDKIEMLARYFGILKSDLIEEKGDNKTYPPETITLSEGEGVLIGLFRQLPEEAQNMYLEVLRASQKNLSKDQ